MWKSLLFILFVFFSPAFVHAKLVRYKLEINTKTVNYTGKEVEALVINNQIPAPVISAFVGDVLEVTFENKMDEDSSIHWHGVLLPNDQDGVPYLTTQPIKARSSFTYRFKVKHSGTYWYHSHTGLQEQRGLYGPIIFRPKSGERIKSNRDYVVMFSDWTDENPNQILANLKKDGDWYALKKNSVQSWNRVIAHGMRAIKNRLYGAWARMGPMDISDVGYDMFLSNGKQKSDLYAKPKETVRLRLINGAASSYFNVEFAGGPMTLVAADGMDVEPIKVKRLKMAIAETYDVIVPIPHKKSYELRSTSEDGTGFSSVFIGEGEKLFAPDIPRPNLFMTEHKGHGQHNSDKADHKEHGQHTLEKKDHKKHGQHNSDKADHKEHGQHTLEKMNHKKRDQHTLNKKEHKGHTQHNSDKADHKEHGQHTSDKKEHKRQPQALNEMDSYKKHEQANNQQSYRGNKTNKSPNVINNMTDYRYLKSVQNTDLGKVQRRVVLRLTGNMEKYIWTFNNKTLLESDKILIKKGETVRFVLINETMMHHPIHLHGHFFRVLNGQAERSPLKHTVDVPAMKTVEIEFKANEEKDWFFHCHNLYHMKTGMSRVISYGTATTKKDRKVFSKLSTDPWYFSNDISVMYNMIEGESRASNTRNAFEVEYDYNYWKSYDFDLIYIRSISRFLEFYGGLSLESQNLYPEPLAVLGVRYVLPFFIEADLRINSQKKIQLEFESSLQLMERVKLEWKANIDKEYRVKLSYEWNKNFLITAAYDSEFKQGAGIRLKF